MDITFHLEAFDGPLDLLLSLIAKNKVSIMDIPIAKILEQYLEYLGKMQRFDMTVASDFVAMAAQLTYIKSKMLLPKYEAEEEDPRAELVKALLEYQHIKKAGERLSQMEEIGRDIFVKQAERIAKDKSFKGNFEVGTLIRAINNLLERSERSKPLAIGSFKGIVGKEVSSVNQKIELIVGLFLKSDRVSLWEILNTAQTRSDIVAIFLAVLELTKIKKVEIIEKDEDCVLVLAPLGDLEVPVYTEEENGVS